MSTPSTPSTPAAGSASRPEYVRALEPLNDVVLVRALPWRQRLWDSAWLRKCVILLAFAGIWQIVAMIEANDLLVPTFTDTMRAFVEGFLDGSLPARAATSLYLLVRGYLCGVACAFALTTLAVSTRLGRDILDTLSAMLNPLPAIALLPLALLWFGLGNGSLIFVLTHSVLWPLAVNTYTGFRSVPATLRMAGRNYGLRGLRYVLLILVPAALPSILAGLRISWASAWRTLIAAELVFGASSGRGGLGWYIFQNRNELLTDRVFAGLTLVIAIGLVFENLVFGTLERVTVRRWGMQH